MKNKKLIIGIIIGIVVAIIALLTVIIVNNKMEDRKFEESDYITKGQYFEAFIEEYNLYSNEYSDEEIENAEDYSIEAAIMYEWDLITKKQAKNPEKPLTKELVAQTVVNMMTFRQTHNVEIKDISKCHDKQAIIDAVGMEIFELKNGNFNPNDYMTYDDIEEVFEKVNNIELNSHYPENNWGDEEYETVPADKWTDLKITLNKKEYQITKNMKVSDFVNNGWKATYGEETLNQTIEELQKSIENSDMLYIGYNSVYLEQDNLSLGVYFDMSIPNSKVIDSRVTAITVYNKEENKSSDFDFYGLKIGQTMTEKQYKGIFGEKNFVMLEDDINNYYRKSIELADDFEVGLELTTRVDTNKLVSITISENQ